MRDKRVVQSVGTLEEETYTSGDEADKCWARVRVHDTSDDHEQTGKSNIDVEKDLLAPRSRHSVYVIGGQTTQGAEDDVQESKQSSPVTRILKAKLEVGAVVVSKDAVDRQLAAESAEVADTEDKCLRRKDNGKGIFEGWLLNNFSANGVEHLFLAHLSFVVAEGTASVVELLLLAGDIRGGWCARGLLCGLLAADLTSASDINDSALESVGAKVAFGNLETIGPFTSGGIIAAEEEGQGNSGNQNTRNNEGYTPSNVAGKALVRHERSVDGRHDEVCDTTTGVTKTSGQGVGGADDVLVVETGCPYLARYERATKNTNEESENIETSGTCNGTSQEGGESTKKQATSECVSGTEAITSRTSDQTDEKSSSQGDNVGVGDLVLGDTDVLGDDIAEQGRECVPVTRVSHCLGEVVEIRLHLPRPECQQETEP